MFTESIIDYEFPVVGLCAIGTVERETVSIPGPEHALHPEGRERAVADSEGECTRAWAEGFLYEDKGFSVYAKFPKPVLLAEEHPDRRPRSDQAAFMREVSSVWPGVAAHG